MDDEDLLNIRCPYCRRVFTCNKDKIPGDKPFFNAKCPYCEEGLVLSADALLKSAQPSLKRSPRA